MAHHVYQSSAFILKGTNIGDANKFIDVFTRELGLIRAAAQSVRLERSKLRYSLQPYTFGNVSLVRGREVWRVTGAIEEWSAYHEFRTDKEKLLLITNVVALLRRLLQGEEQNEYLFDTLVSFLDALRDSQYTEEELKGIEYLTVLRMLYSLGYVKNQDNLFSNTEYTDELISFVVENKKNIVAEINQALKESHL